MKKSSGRHLFSGYYWVMTFFLYLPILLLVVFSFNNSTLLTFPLKEFTFKWYGQLAQTRELIKAVYNSLLIAFVSSLVTTVISGMAALALTRYNFKLKGFFLSLTAMPMIIPFVVLGVAMMVLFRSIGIPFNLWTVGVGHVVINIPYTLLIITARLAGFDKSLEEAAMDLGANYWQTILRVILPIALPAMIAAFLTSFTSSFNEFALAFFLTGRENTLPMYLYSQLRFPSQLPLVVTLASLTMVATIGIVIFAEWLQRFGGPATIKGETQHE